MFVLLQRIPQPSRGICELIRERMPPLEDLVIAGQPSGVGCASAIAVIVGGSGKFFGPVVGTVIIVLLPEALRASSAPWLKFMQTWYLAVFGLAVVVLMVWLPGGLLSIPGRFRRKGTAR